VSQNKFKIFNPKLNYLSLNHRLSALINSKLFFRAKEVLASISVFLGHLILFHDETENDELFRDL